MRGPGRVRLLIYAIRPVIFKLPTLNCHEAGYLYISLHSLTLTAMMVLVGLCLIR